MKLQLTAQNKKFAIERAKELGYEVISCKVLRKGGCYNGGQYFLDVR